MQRRINHWNAVLHHGVLGRSDFRRSMAAFTTGFGETFDVRAFNQRCRSLCLCKNTDSHIAQMGRGTADSRETARRRSGSYWTAAVEKECQFLRSSGLCVQPHQYRSGRIKVRSQSTIGWSHPILRRTKRILFGGKKPPARKKGTHPRRFQNR